jgi:ligand-binding sensor domain-containing protein/signal transduction histidine kinase
VSPGAARPVSFHGRSFALVAALALTAWPRAGSALDPAKAITQYGHDVWRIEDGLPSSGVSAFAETRDGYLWVGTYEGLARFDGVRFTVFDPSNTPEMRSGVVLDLAEDRDGALWLVTRGGVLRHRAGRFARVDSREGEPGVQARAITQDPGGTLWVAAESRGLFRVEGDSLVPYSGVQPLPTGNMANVHADPEGTLWIAYRTGGLVSLKEGVVRRYTVADGLLDDAIRTIADAPGGGLWIGTAKGLNHRPANGRLTSRVAGDDVRAILADRDGTLWLGTNEGGLLRLRGDGPPTRHSKPQGFSDTAAWALHEDQEGSLWVGTADAGLSRFRDASFTPIGAPEGLSGDVVTTLHADMEDTVWAGTRGGGLNRVRGGQIASFSVKEGLSGDVVTGLGTGPGGTLWVGTNDDGLNRLHEGRITILRSLHDLTRVGVFALLTGRDGGLWVGTRGNGLGHLSGSTLTTYRQADGLLNPFVWDLVEDGAGTLWIATSRGVYTLAGGRIRAVAPISARDLHLDADGVLWVAGAGLHRWKDGKAFTFTAAEGLAEVTMGSVLEDDAQNLWLGSSKGVSRISKKQLHDVADGRARRVTAVTFDTSDGMRTREVNFGKGCKTRDGRLWFPTGRGLVVVDPRHLRRNPRPPPVHIERVVADGREVVHAGAGLTQVPPGEGRLEFQFTALSYLAPKKTRFAYRLEGFDKDWSEPSARRDATYTRLRPGAYTFRVKASNGDGVWNDAGASFPLYLEPHFHQTAWFYALCAATVVAGAWRLHQLRVRRLLELERVRTRLAADLHDDVGAGLSQIAVLSEVVRRQLAPDGSRALESLDRITRTAGELVDSMSDIVWAVNPSKDRLEDLVHRMRRFANDLEAARGLEIAVRATVPEPGQKLGPDFRRHAYLIFKEAVSNAARHSGCGKIEVALDVGQGGLFLRVQDDGRGFDPSSKSEGHGLQTMLHRASELGGRAEIVSRPGNGTALSVHVPLAGSGGGGRWRWRRPGHPGGQPARAPTSPPEQVSDAGPAGE